MARESGVIKVVALCGSLRKASFHRGLVRAAIEICEKSLKGMEIEYVEISNLPFQNVDLETAGAFPPEVESFRQKIKEADSVLFASPEFNYSVTAPLKNAIDWASRPPNAWAGKAGAIVSAGGNCGGVRAQYHLRQIGVFVDIHFINKPEFILPVFSPPPKFDAHSNLTHQESKLQLHNLLLALYQFTLKLKGE